MRDDHMLRKHQHSKILASSKYENNRAISNKQRQHMLKKQRYV